MSTEYDDKIVRMQFDNKNFESGVQTTIASLDQLKASLKFDGVTQGIDNLAGKVKNVSFDNMTQGIEQVVVKIPVMGTVLDQTIRNMTNSVTSFVKTTLDKFSTLGNMKSGFGEYELQIGAVKTIVASTGESVETVNKYLEELNKYADDTIYSFSDMTQNIGKFTNAGVKLEDAVAAIKGIANEAALSGANANEASRAMYNFAQALSAGSVKLIDWKSIENANMATVGFKNELIKTALELGTIRQEGNKYITTTTDLSGKVSEAFDATTLFNESLSHQWMTTKVLTTTLKRYTDTETELGQQATEAATKVNTFHQALDAIIEGLGSSWAQSWQYIIGDFNEATNVWTKFKDTVEGILGPSNDARNAMLKFWATGKDGSEEAIELTEEEIKKYQELYDVAHKGVMGDWGNGQERVDKLTAAGYDYAEVQGVINKMVDGTIKSVEDLARAQQKEQAVEAEGMTGRQMFLKGLSNLSTAIGKFAGAIRDAWRDVFPRKDGNALVAMSAAFMKFTEKLIITDKTADEIRRTFRGLFSVLGLVATIIKAVIKGIGALVNALVSGGKKSDATIWTLTAYIGDLLTMITAIAKESGIFEAIFVGLGKVIGTVGHTGISIIASLASAVFELIKSFLGLGSAVINLDSITNVFAGCAAAVAGFTDFIADKVAAFGFIPVTGIETFTANVKNAFGFFTQEGGPFAKAVDIFLAAWEKLKIGLSIVAKVLAPVAAFIKKHLEELVGGELTLENFLSFLKSGGALVLMAELVMLIRNLQRVLNDFVGVGHATTKMFDAFGDTAKAMTKKLKIMTLKLLAAALFQIALAIAVMVGAIYLLSKMDSDALKKGLTAFTAIMAELIIALRNMKNEHVGEAAKTLMALGIAVFLLTKAVMTLGTANSGDVLVGIGLMTLIINRLVSASEDLMKTSNVSKMEGVAKTILALAVAVLILMIPIKVLGKMKFWDLVQGIVAVGLLIEVICDAMRRMGSLDIDGAARTILAISIALILLIVPIKVLGEMNLLKLIQGGLAVIVLLAAMVLALHFLSEMEFDMAQIAMLWSVLAAIIILSIIAVALGDVETDKLKKGIIAVGIIIALFVVMIWLINKIFKDVKVNKIKAVTKVLLMIIGMIAAFVVLLLVLKTFKSDELGDVAKVVGAVGLAILLICAGLALLVKVMGSLSEVKLAAISSALFSAGLVAVAIAAAIWLAVDAFEKLNDMEISPNLMKNMQMFGAFLLLLIENMIGGAIGAIIAAGPAVVSAIFATIALILDELDKNISGFVSSIMSILVSIFDGIASSPVDQIVGDLVTILSKAIGGIASKTDEIEQMGKDIVKIICAIFKGITSEDSLNEVAEAIVSFIENVASFLNNNQSKINRLARALIELLKAVIKSAITLIYTLWEEVDKLTNKILSHVNDFLANKVYEAFTALAKHIEEVINEIIDLANGLGLSIDHVDIDEEAWGEAAGNAVKKSLEFLETRMKDVVTAGTYSKLMALKNLLPGRAKGATITTSASGNVVNPSHSIVGEAGPELLSTSKGRTVITPLSNQYARSTTREMMERYTGDISNQLAAINDNIVYANRHTFESTYDDTDIRGDMANMQAEMKGLREDILNVRVMLDTGALVGQLAGPMDNQLGSINKLRVRAAGSIKR